MKNKKKSQKTANTTISAEQYRELKEKDISKALSYQEYIVIFGINPGERTKVSVYGIGKNAHRDVENFIRKIFSGGKIYNVNYV